MRGWLKIFYTLLFIRHLALLGSNNDNDNNNKVENRVHFMYNSMQI